MFNLMMPRRERELVRREFPNEWLRREFATLFDRAFAAWPMPFETPWERHWGIEMEETPNEFVVRAELPGFETNELEVLLEGNLLTIRAEPHRAVEEKEPVERPYGRLERTLTLPEAVVSEKIEARYRNGVLEVHLPRTPEARPRRIAVTT